MQAILTNEQKMMSIFNDYGPILYIDDLIDLIFKIFSNKRSRGRIFNAGSGKPIKIKNLIEKIKKISKGGIPEYGKIKMRKDEIDIMYPNIKLSRKARKV